MEDGHTFGAKLQLPPSEDEALEEERTTEEEIMEMSDAIDPTEKFVEIYESPDEAPPSHPQTYGYGPPPGLVVKRL